jgi:hypothetical protein
MNSGYQLGAQAAYSIKHLKQPVLPMWSWGRQELANIRGEIESEMTQSPSASSAIRVLMIFQRDLQICFRLCY